MKKILVLAVLLGTMAFSASVAVARDGERYLPEPRRQVPALDQSQLTAVLGPSAVLAAGSQTGAQEVVYDGSLAHGIVSGKWADSRGTHLIAVDGTPFAVPDEFWTQVRIGDTVQRIGGTWTIVVSYESGAGG